MGKLKKVKQPKTGSAATAKRNEAQNNLFAIAQVSEAAQKKELRQRTAAVKHEQAGRWGDEDVGPSPRKRKDTKPPRDIIRRTAAVQ